MTSAMRRRDKPVKMIGQETEIRNGFKTRLDVRGITGSAVLHPRRYMCRTWGINDSWNALRGTACYVVA
jgi:hypothetical protein